MMVDTKDIRVDRSKTSSRSINFFSLALSVMVPYAPPLLGLAFGVLGVVFGVVFIAGGVYAYRHSKDAALRAIAIAGVAGGIIVILIGFLILYGLAAYTITTPSIEKYPGR